MEEEKIFGMYCKQIGKSFGDTVEVVLQERESEKTSLWKCPKCERESPDIAKIDQPLDSLLRIC